MRGRGVESVFTHYFYETGHQVRRQAGKIIERKKEKTSVSSPVEETVYQPKEQIVCLLVNIRKITVQLAIYK